MIVPLLSPLDPAFEPPEVFSWPVWETLWVDLIQQGSFITSLRRDLNRHNIFPFPQIREGQIVLRGPSRGKPALLLVLIASFIKQLRETHLVLFNNIYTSIEPLKTLALLNHMGFFSSAGAQIGSHQLPLDYLKRT